MVAERRQQRAIHPLWWGVLAVVLVVAACVRPIQQLHKLRAQHAVQDAQWMQLQQLAAQAQQLRALAGETPQSSGAEALPALVQQLLGTQAQVRQSGGTGVLTLQSAPASVVVPALEQLRQAAALSYTAAQLQQAQGLLSGTVEFRGGGQ